MNHVLKFICLFSLFTFYKDFPIIIYLMIFKLFISSNRVFDFRFNHKIGNRMVSNYSKRLILDPVNDNDYQIKGIVFDMDGTLCVAQTWMFSMFIYFTFII